MILQKSGNFLHLKQKTLKKELKKVCIYIEDLISVVKRQPFAI